VHAAHNRAKQRSGVLESGCGGRPRPYGTYIDKPAKVPDVWPIIDEVTAEHGIVTSLFVSAYGERRGERMRG
jgi:hypothetical protein